jgi:hypothetical protein
MGPARNTLDRMLTGRHGPRFGVTPLRCETTPTGVALGKTRRRSVWTGPCPIISWLASNFSCLAGSPKHADRDAPQEPHQCDGQRAGQHRRDIAGRQAWGREGRKGRITLPTMATPCALASKRDAQAAPIIRANRKTRQLRAYVCSSTPTKT